jgi:hypothetical protein
VIFEALTAMTMKVAVSGMRCHVVNGFQSALVRINEELLERKVAAQV